MQGTVKDQSSNPLGGVSVYSAASCGMVVYTCTPLVYTGNDGSYSLDSSQLAGVAGALYFQVAGYFIA